MLKKHVFINDYYWYLDEAGNIRKVRIGNRDDNFCIVIIPEFKNGIELTDHSVDFAAVKYEDLFETEAIAITERDNRIEEKRRNFESSINSAEDLLNVMLRTIIELDESCYKELEVAVMREKAKELLGVKLE